MRNSKIYEDLGFIKRAKNREKVLKALITPKNPATIGKETGIGLNMSSRALRELEKRGLVKCVNPKWKVGRIYKLTERGKSVLKLLSSV